MDIELICSYESAHGFISEMKDSGGREPAELWEKHMIQPYWDRIAQWAPVDQSYMKPAAIADLEILEQQAELLARLDKQSLQKELVRITRLLPKQDEDPIAVAIYPNNSPVVKERQNGVVGACVFGNILINVNPLAADWERWMRYVFSHEYHHSVWGHYWYVCNGGLDGTFLEYAVSEGQADLFAMSLFPDLKPQWITPLDQEQETDWWNKVKPVMFSTDRRLFDRYMFGDEKEGLPWCMGYTIGNRIVSRYLAAHPQVTLTELVAVHPREILRGCGLPV